MISDKRLKEIATCNVSFDDDIPEFTDEQLTKFSRQKDNPIEEIVNELNVVDRFLSN